MWSQSARERRRLLARGDLKYLVLELLRERPAHGYEVIRTLEERFGGLYTPSPGAIYPVLDLLAELGYITAQQQEDRKVFSLTANGERFLAEAEPLVAEIRARLEQWSRPELQEELAGVSEEFRHLARELHRRLREGEPSTERLREVQAVLAQATRDVSRLLPSRTARRVDGPDRPARNRPAPFTSAQQG
jgi:DNA-binding PadR family transcriptional regulator